MAGVRAFSRKVFRPIGVTMEAMRRIRSAQSDGWTAEGVALCIAAASLSGAGVLLLRYDKKPISDWHGKFTLNATISVLATLARTMMLVSTAACMSQYGWIWYSGELYPLKDFQLISEASRGPAGSLKMLLRLIPVMFQTRRSLASIGCCVVILAQMLDPFLQQVLTTTYQTSSSLSATTPYASKWSNAQIIPTFKGILEFPVKYWSDVITEPEAHVHFDINGAINTGFSANATEIMKQLRVGCGSGKCSWEKYHSLAVCGKCNDVTSEIRKGTRQNISDLASWFQDENGVKEPVDITWYNLDFPSHLSQTINNPNDYSTNSTERITMTGLVNWNAGYTKTFTECSTLLVSMSFLWADFDQHHRYSNWANANVEASECGLYLCVREYHTKMANGSVDETSTEVSSTRATNSYQINDGPENAHGSIFNLLDPDLRTGRTDLEIQVPDSAASQGPFTMTQAGVTGLITALTKAFDDGTLWYTSPNLQKRRIDRHQILQGVTGMVRSIPNSDRLQYVPDVMEVFWSNRGINQSSKLFDNLAASLTNSIRSTADKQTVFTGSQESKIAIFQVRWRWIAPSALAVLLAVIFQIIVCRETRRTRTPIWKGSTLAILFHGLSVSLKNAMPPRIYISETDEQAKAVNVVLTEMDNGICLDGKIVSQENNADAVPLISTSGDSKHSQYSATPVTGHLNAAAEALGQIANTS